MGKKRVGLHGEEIQPGNPELMADLTKNALGQTQGNRRWKKPTQLIHRPILLPRKIHRFQKAEINLCPKTDLPRKEMKNLGPHPPLVAEIRLHDNHKKGWGILYWSSILTPSL